MRIIAGQAKGRRLKVPSGRSVRPTSDRIREAVFNILVDRIAGAKVLDLFAGSGSLGIEALSRGADSAVFVEKSPKHLPAIKENIQTCGFADKSSIIRNDYRKALTRLSESGTRFDLVFLDPPYHEIDWEELIENRCWSELLSEDALLIAEHDSHMSFPDYGIFSVQDCRKYGDTAVAFCISRTGKAII